MVFAGLLLVLNHFYFMDSLFESWDDSVAKFDVN
jgi:hypothetical protein